MQPTCCQRSRGDRGQHPQKEPRGRRAMRDRGERPNEALVEHRARGEGERLLQEPGGRLVLLRAAREAQEEREGVRPHHAPHRGLHGGVWGAGVLGQGR